MARPKGYSSSLIFEELEPRVLLSADGAESLAVEVVQEQEYEEPVVISEAPEEVILISAEEENPAETDEPEESAEQETEPATEAAAEAPTSEQPEEVSNTVTPPSTSNEEENEFIEAPKSHELVLVNSDVKDKEQLTQEIGATGDEHTEYEIIVLDSQQDGVQQVSDILEEQDELDAIHFISHGDEGELALGNDWITGEDLAERGELISTWGDALGEEGDILLYGCSIAGDSDGETFVDQLAALTGADVAASDDTTGSSELGGDWELEYTAGDIEAPSLFSTLTSWGGTLTTYAYEGFDYSEGYGQLDNQTGGSGWANGWNEQWLLTEILDYSLADPTGTLATEGGSLELHSVPNIFVGQTRSTVTPLGADGTTAWFSFLVQPEISAAGDWAGIVFGDVFVGHVGNNYVIQKSGGEGQVVAASATGGETALLVVKAEFAAGNDTLSLYVNPDPLLSSPDTTAAVKNDFDVSYGAAFYEITITAGDVPYGFNTSIIDELRIGSDYADVTPTTSVSLITVTTTEDVIDSEDGEISLREAIITANTTLGTDKIAFDIDGSGPHVITLDVANGALPDITDTIMIDGTTEPDYDSSPVIQIDGSSLSAVAGDAFDGLRLMSGSDGSIITGLSITGFTDAGAYGEAIEIQSDNNTIIGNFIGIASDGTTVTANRVGIALQDEAAANTIGSINDGGKNLITGNTYADVVITDNNTDDNMIIGNDIGLDADGNSVDASNYGIVIANNAEDNIVGGDEEGAGNRISGHDTGIVVTSDERNAIIGNTIYDNQQMAIDLDDDGVTLNDPLDSDTGANFKLNYPVLTSVSQNGEDLDVTVSLDVPAGDYRIELYENPNGLDGIGLGEGQTYLGAFTITSSGEGFQSFSETLTNTTATSLATISATATEDYGDGSYGGTSEFGPSATDTTLTLNPTQDTFLDRANYNYPNYGTSTTLRVDKDGDGLGEERTILQFDLSSVPADATITSATLKLNATGNEAAFTINVYEITTPWVEGTGGTNQAANWKEATESVDWNDKGGDVDATVIASLYTGSTGWHSWDITTLVQSWVTGASENNGLMLASPDTGDKKVIYESRETSKAPELIISYTTPTINTAPALDTTPLVGLDAIDQEAGIPNGAVGTMVTELVDLDDSSGLDNVTDPDTGALTGIALTATDSSHGTWYYSTDDGSNWEEVGTVSDTAARLLAADTQTRIYFQPDSGFNGTVATAITFRAWDQNAGTNGGTADVSTAGGTSAFSLAEETAFITVNPVAEVKKTDTAITIDGTVDAAWDTATAHSIGLTTLGSENIADTDDLSGSFRTLWDDTNLYILVEVNDETLIHDSTDLWHDDTIEIFIDPDYSQESNYDGINDYQICFRAADGVIQPGDNSLTDTTGMLSSFDISAGGYTAEIVLPWATLNVTPTGGNFIGFEIQIDDDDDGGNMDTKISWNIDNELVYLHPSLFGTMQLMGNTTPVITGDSSRAVTEDVDTAGYLEASGVLNITDADDGESTFTAETITGTYGELTIESDGNWSYSADNSQLLIQQLDAGQSPSDTFTVTTFDGTAHGVTITINGAEDAPVVGDAISATVEEDGTLTVSDLLTISDIDAPDNSISWQDEGPVATAYGTFQMAANGTWSYTLNNDLTAVQQLQSGDTLTDTYTFTASDSSTTQEISVTINGAADAAVITGTDTGTVTEDDGATLVTTGTLSITDADAGDDQFQAMASINGTYGTLSIDTGGAWTYQADNNQTAIQQLDSGESTQDAIVIHSKDGTPHQIKITIDGVDDITIIGGENTGSVVEDDGALLQVTGSLTTTDLGGFKPEPNISGSYGNLSIDALGNWVYQADNTQTAIQALGLGEFTQDILTVESNDGTQENITVTINGINDLPAIGGTVTGTITEDDGPDVNDKLHSSGTLTITDTDTDENTFLAETQIGAYGSFTVDASGNWSYEADNTLLAIQELDAGDGPQDIFTVTSGDGSTTHNITITVNGAEDTATVGGDTSGSVTEDGAQTSTGTLTISDVDTDDTPTWYDQLPVAGSSDLGTFYMASGNWTYDLDNTAVQYLDEGESTTDSFTFTASDDTSQMVTVTIHGAEDAAIIGGDTSGTVTEDSLLTTTGILTITDEDSSDTPGWNDLTPTAGDLGHGYFEITGGSWGYTLSNSAVQGLKSGETVTDTITFTATDSSAQQVTITINGTDDAPLIGGPITGTVAEDGTLTTTGTLTISDTDTGDNPTWNDQSATDGTNGFGSFQMSAGNWTYTLNNAAVQYLDDGETATDTFHFTASDGTNQTVTVVIIGAEDMAVASGTNTGAVSEGNIGDGPETATGTFTLIDPDSSDIPTFTDISSTLGNSGYGHFMMSASTWTYTLDQTAVQDLASTQITTDSFTFTATDGTSRTVTVTISGSNDSPTAAPQTMPPLVSSSSRIITQAMLLDDATDVDGDTLTASGLALTSGNGTLTNNPDGTWEYVPAANDTTTATFTYTISDGSLVVAANASLEIQASASPPETEKTDVEPVSEETIIREKTADERAVAEVVAQPEIETLPVEPEQEETPVVAAEEDEVQSSTIEGPDVAEEAADVSPKGTTDDTAEKEAQDEDKEAQPAKPTIIIAQEAEGLHPGNSNQGHESGPAAFMQTPTVKNSLAGTTTIRQVFNQRPTIQPASTTALLLTRFIEQAAFTNEVEYAAAVDQLREALDTFKEEVADETQYYKTVVGSAIAVSTGLSVGYVVWLIRGGMLLSSVLFSMPAWQLADPLPLLSNSQHLEGEDDEDLEQIIKNGSTPLPQPSGKQNNSGSRG